MILPAVEDIKRWPLARFSVQGFDGERTPVLAHRDALMHMNGQRWIYAVQSLAAQFQVPAGQSAPLGKEAARRRMHRDQVVFAAHTAV